MHVNATRSKQTMTAIIIIVFFSLLFDLDEPEDEQILTYATEKSDKCLILH